MQKQIPHANGTRLGQRTLWTSVLVRASSFFTLNLFYPSNCLAGTHCPILHEPPPEHNFIFVPENGSALTLLQSNNELAKNVDLLLVQPHM